MSAFTCKTDVLGVPMAEGFERSDGVTREQCRYRFNVKGSATAMQRQQRRLATLDRRGTGVRRDAPSCRRLCNAFIDHHRPVDAARVSERKPPMENAKHIGCMWALAVALGVGMAVANSPAVALAAPSDSGKGSSSGESSPSSSSRHSGSTSSDTPSAKSALSATNDAPSRHRRPLNPPGETAASSSGGPQTSTRPIIRVGRAGGMRATPETPGTVRGTCGATSPQGRAPHRRRPARTRPYQRGRRRPHHARQQSGLHPPRRRSHSGAGPSTAAAPAMAPPRPRPWS